MQPGRHFRFASKIPQIAKRGKKSFLRRVARVFFAAEHPERESKDAPLPATHYFTERLWIAREGAFNHLFIVRGGFHLVHARLD